MRAIQKQSEAVLKQETHPPKHILKHSWGEGGGCAEGCAAGDAFPAEVLLKTGFV